MTIEPMNASWTGRRLAALAPALLWLMACGDEPLEVDSSARALAARCTVSVEGQGSLDMEQDYVPHVVACENGNADTEALKAQAVAARSFAYYKLASGSGSLKDSQADQVYSCGRSPGPEHLAAAQATQGQVLVYSSAVICAFYVAGGKGTPPACQGGSSATEHYVTYNEGKSGSGLTQSSLGWVSPSNMANRGCMSQNGADCLAQAGRNYVSILQFYYGADIQLTTAPGACVTAQPIPDPSAPPGEPEPPTPEPPTPEPPTPEPPACDPQRCADEQQGICCGDACVDWRSDPAHCGGCGQACAPDERCAPGADPQSAHCVETAPDSPQAPPDAGPLGQPGGEDTPSLYGGCRIGPAGPSAPLLLLLGVVGLVRLSRRGRRRGSPGRPASGR